MTTREGYRYQKDNTFSEGLPCSAVIGLRTNFPASVSDDFDVIVVGAGYAGLTASRDLWYKVLLLEARDRIGGRTYTANVDGHLYEMGGAWIHWNQPHVYHEMHRYDQTAMLNSYDEEIGCQSFTASVNGEKISMSHLEEAVIVEKVFEEFCNVDGDNGRLLLPYPHDPHHNSDVKDWEAMSAAQRLDQIKSLLSDVELATLKAFLAAISGNTMEKTGFLDILRWWALSGYNARGLDESTETYKIAAGQSHFARCFFDEALATGNLRYSFETVVGAVNDLGSKVMVSSVSGQKWVAKRLVCTVPLNTLSKVQFNPPLPPLKFAASHKGHINFGAKVHLEAEGSYLRSWTAANWPDKRVFTCRGDGLTPAGNTHLVCFGSNKEHASPQEDAQEFAMAVKKIQPMDIRQVIWHNWLVDPFSRGTWCMFSPGYSFRYLDALRERHGNILLASADWASGWRGFIDGAMEEGSRAAKQITDELCVPKTLAAHL